MAGERADGTTRAKLVVDNHALSAGRESVGLPDACSSDAMLERYVTLIRVARTGSLTEPVQLRRDDLDVLARATGLEADAVVRHLTRLLEPAVA